MFPVPKAMFSSKVSVILLLVAIPVAPSVGILEIKVGPVSSAVLKFKVVSSVIPA